MINNNGQELTERTGRYIYGIAEHNGYVCLGDVGIDGSTVYTISYADFSAIVHDCQEEPYQSEDDEVVKRWIMEHQRVLDIAQAEFTTVVPLGFDNIVKCKDETENAEIVVQNWLKDDLPHIIEVIEKIKGKDEYVIQISVDYNNILATVLQKSEKIRKMQENINSQSPGMAYIYKTKLEKLKKNELDGLINSWFQDFYRKIKPYSEEIIIEKNKKTAKEIMMIINLTCLVGKGNLAALGEVLEEINNREGFSVHFSGPWPPYSFVAKPAENTDDTTDKT
ncbi:MAG: GvpL/GvpF family gas vesicle protein [Syntrophomonas sp.]